MSLQAKIIDSSVHRQMYICVEPAVSTVCVDQCDKQKSVFRYLTCQYLHRGGETATLRDIRRCDIDVTARVLPW